MAFNSWLHRLITPGVARLTNTGVTPNHLTTLRLLTGLGAAAAFASGGALGASLGGALFVVSIVLDHADGILARLTARTTRFGRYFDLWTDAAVNSLVFVGVGIGLGGGWLGPWGLVLGLAAGGAVAMTYFMVAHVQYREGGHDLELNWIGIDIDHALFLVPIAAWTDWLDILLLAAMVAAPGFLIWITMHTIKSSRPIRGRADDP